MVKVKRRTKSIRPPELESSSDSDFSAAESQRPSLHRVDTPQETDQIVS